MKKAKKSTKQSKAMGSDSSALADEKLTAHEKRIFERCLSVADRKARDEAGLYVAMINLAFPHEARATGTSSVQSLMADLKRRWSLYKDIMKGAGLWLHSEVQQLSWTACADGFRKDMQALSKRELAPDIEDVGNVLFKVNAGRLRSLQRAEQRALGRQAAHDRSRRVVVIHGRDLLAKTEAVNVLTACGLQHVDFEAAQKERAEVGHDYIHEVIEELFTEASAALVVLTPEETSQLVEVYRNEKDPLDSQARLQPRPNVLLEFGLALGRFGRNVIVLEFGRVELPSDLAGLHTIRSRPNKLAVAREVYQKFKNLGLDVVPPQWGDAAPASAGGSKTRASSTTRRRS